MKHKIIIVVCFLFLSSFLHAGFSKGNGGNVLFCDDGHHFVLDYFELSNWYQLHPDEAVDNVEMMMERWEKHFSSSVDEMKKIVSSLKRNVYYTEFDQLGKVDDVFAVTIPKSCRLEQVAIQRNGRIILSRPLFDLLSFSQQNVLLLHEVVYSFLLSKSNLFDGRPVRAFTALLLSKELESWNQEEKMNFIRKNHIIMK